MITPTGIKPIPKKIEAITRLQRPKTIKQLKSFLGMVNFYRDTWAKRSHILAPLSDLIKNGKPFTSKPSKRRSAPSLERSCLPTLISLRAIPTTFLGVGMEELYTTSRVDITPTPQECLTRAQ